MERVGMHGRDSSSAGRGRRGGRSCRDDPHRVPAGCSAHTRHEARCSEASRSRRRREIPDSVGPAKRSSTSPRRRPASRGRSATRSPRSCSLSVDGVYVTDDVVMTGSPITRELRSRHAVRGSSCAASAFRRRRLGAGGRSRARSPVPLPHGCRGHPRLRRVVPFAGAVRPQRCRREPGRKRPVPERGHRLAARRVARRRCSRRRPGHRLLKYSIVWSNEDGGTSTPALMARWGRTTDIEWIYQVEVDALGHTVPGTAVFQSAGHGTAAFNGVYEGDRPLLQTCTLNNNVCDRVDDPMRFSLSTEATLDANDAGARAGHGREPVDVSRSWPTRCAGKARSSPHPIPRRRCSSPTRATISTSSCASRRSAAEQRRVLGRPHDRRPAQGRPDVVPLRQGLCIPTGRCNTTTPPRRPCQLPPGTRPFDIAEIDAIRVPFGPDTGATIEVNTVNRALPLESRATGPDARSCRARHLRPLLLRRPRPSSTRHRNVSLLEQRT